MTVPEAPVNEHRDPKSCEHQIGATREPFVTEAVAQTEPMKPVSQLKLGLGIALLY
jgi:hypothetical protein